ncbi:hypothetical protein PR048_029155 [Dryococelus australis]|uniref:CUB domain-containing protein n=1 Tax=Dryococelus australis TaxID=614101 RepID=A0ABQ9GCL9_9NEOP|nr:hypothetical protein PR048_029155 [Dryococelus australis]
MPLATHHSGVRSEEWMHAFTCFPNCCHQEFPCSHTHSYLGSPPGKTAKHNSKRWVFIGHIISFIDKIKIRVACGGLIDVSNGTITSPSFPEFYPGSKNCVWEIMAPPQYRITLNFTHFDLEGNNVSSSVRLAHYTQLCSVC